MAVVHFDDGMSDGDATRSAFSLYHGFPPPILPAGQPNKCSGAAAT